jgi:hypothetical protein
LVVAIVGLGGYLWWNQQQKAAAAEHGEQLALALDAVEAHNLDDGAAKLAALAKQSGDGIEAAARVMQAAVAAAQGKTPDAKRLFGEVAADKSAPQPYRDLSAIRAVAVDFDTLPPADVVARLKPLAVPGTPWFGSAGELVGIAYIKQNRRDLAGPLFASIAKDKDVPQSQRNRARQMASLLGVDAIDDVAGAAGMAPGRS